MDIKVLSMCFMYQKWNIQFTLGLRVILKGPVVGIHMGLGPDTNGAAPFYITSNCCHKLATQGLNEKL